jgi:hypothetical protein
MGGGGQVGGTSSSKMVVDGKGTRVIDEFARFEEKECGRITFLLGGGGSDSAIDLSTREGVGGDAALALRCCQRVSFAGSSDWEVDMFCCCCCCCCCCF